MFQLEAGVALVHFRDPFSPFPQFSHSPFPTSPCFSFFPLSNFSPYSVTEEISFCYLVQRIRHFIRLNGFYLGIL